MDRLTTAYDHAQAGNWEQARLAYQEAEATLAFLERSINHFVTYEREILARRLGITPIHHRLGKELSDFGVKTATRLAAELGPLL